MTDRPSSRHPYLLLVVVGEQVKLYPDGDRAALASALRMMARLIIENPSIVDHMLGTCVDR